MRDINTKTAEEEKVQFRKIIVLPCSHELSKFDKADSEINCDKKNEGAWVALKNRSDCVYGDNLLSFLPSATQQKKTDCNNLYHQEVNYQIDWTLFNKFYKEETVKEVKEVNKKPYMVRSRCRNTNMIEQLLLHSDATLKEGINLRKT